MVDGKPNALQFIGTLLIVDDDEKTRNMLESYFSAEGFRVLLAASGAEMRSLISGPEIDLVLLDIGLPGEDGLKLAGELRQNSNIGIIMVTGRGDIVDRVVGIELGADDYISKPFHLREVLARVKAVLRRIGAGARSKDAEPPDPGDDVALSFDKWRFYPDRRYLVDARGEEVALTTGEYDMLTALVRNAGRVLTRDQLMDLTRGRRWDAFDRTIDAQICRLRRKLEPDPRHPTLIKSVRGVGYVFTARVRQISGAPAKAGSDRS